MRETSKCFEFRKASGDFDNYLRGEGIDVGCGYDLLKIENGSVQPWDFPHGDAQLMAGVLDGKYDFVYSSHCLEHMRDVPESLRNWTRILKSGGFLYLVVPEYILYEKMTWPSVHNGEHTHSFSFLITRRKVQRENHYHVDEDLVPLLEELGMEIVRLTIEDHAFNYNAGLVDQTLNGALCQLCLVAKKK